MPVVVIPPVDATNIFGTPPTSITAFPLVPVNEIRDDPF